MTQTTAVVLHAAEAVSSQFGALAPRGYTSEMFRASLELYLLENPKLAQCTEVSLVRGFLHVARTGLVLGESCDLLPFRERKSGQFEATFVIRARGRIELAYQSGVQAIEADVVREGDEFEIQKGTEFRLLHTPHHAANARITHAYAIARLRMGVYIGVVMTADEIAAHKARYALKPEWKAARLEEVPWYGPKTCTIRLSKYLPASPRFALALQASREPEDLAEEAEIVTEPSPPAFDEGEEVREQAPEVASAITRDTPITWGKSAGTRICDLADAYLDWAVEPGRKFGPDTETWQAVMRAEVAQREEAAAGLASMGAGPAIAPDDADLHDADLPIELRETPEDRANTSAAADFICPFGHDGVKGRRLGEIDTPMLAKSLDWARANKPSRYKDFIEHAATVLADREAAVGQEEMEL